jgi:hypothetical protein
VGGSKEWMNGFRVFCFGVFRLILMVIFHFFGLLEEFDWASPGLSGECQRGATK